MRMEDAMAALGADAVDLGRVLAKSKTGEPSGDSNKTAQARAFRDPRVSNG